MALKHVLIATDFGPASTHALRMAADLASSLDARLSVVHVVAPAPYPYPVPPSDEAVAKARGELEDLAESLGGKASTILREGRPAEEIAAVAAEIEADLVVIGSRGRRGIRRALLGSVAEAVVRLAPAPVLTFHPWRFEDRSEAGRELIEGMRPLRSAAPGLLAISRGALIVAAELGRSLDETPDVLLAMPVVHRGIVLGGLCEDGTLRLDPSIDATSVSSVDRDLAVQAARARLREEVAALKITRGIGEVYGRAMVVVTDGLDEPWCVLAVCDVLRRLRASRIIVATPAASTAARAIVESAVDELIVVRTTDYGADPDHIYRDDRPVTAREAIKCLHTRHSAA